MKKLLLTVVAALSLGAAASAQTPGNWAVGPQLNVYTNAGADGAILGIGAVGRYAFTENWRVQPSITALCKKYCSVDIAADVQYLFGLTRGWKVYPQAGISANDLYGWSAGINLGAGTEFNLSRHWDLNAGFKWMIQTAKYHKNPIVISVGAAYKF